MKPRRVTAGLASFCGQLVFWSLVNQLINSFWQYDTMHCNTDEYVNKLFKYTGGVVMESYLTNKTKRPQM